MTIEEEEEEKAKDIRRVIQHFWDRELAIVMKAGDRHARNYHAWQYARQLSALLVVRCSAGSELAGRRRRRRRRHVVEEGLLRESVGTVRGWCLMHPRDISGWTFLFSLLERLRDGGCDGGAHGDVGGEIGISTRETQEFTRKYEWKGESIDWFLKAVKTLNIDD